MKDTLVKSFSKLRYCIFDLPPTKDIVKVYPELLKYKAIQNSKAKKLNILLRYIIFLHDPNSDIIKDIPDLQSRKVQAARLAGFTVKDDLLTNIFNCTDVDFLDLLECFLKEIFHNRKYREWVTLSQELDEYTRLRLEGIEGLTKVNSDGERYSVSGKEIDKYKAATEKTKLREQCEHINERLDSLENEIFGDHHTVKDLAIKARFTSPETFAGIIKK